MTRRESVLISAVPVMPGVSGMVAPSTLIDPSSSATVTGKTKLSGWPGTVAVSTRRWRSTLRQRASLRLLFGDPP
jgi:hypothetical protein